MGTFTQKTETVENDFGMFEITYERDNDFSDVAFFRVFEDMCAVCDGIAYEENNCDGDDWSPELQALMQRVESNPHVNIIRW